MDGGLHKSKCACSACCSVEISVSHEEMTSNSKVRLFPCVGFHNSMLEKREKTCFIVREINH